MTSDAPATVTGLVVLTVDSESYALTTVDLAVDMAASLKSRIQGLFIEDEDLVRAADLPFTREITFPSAQERTTDASMMRRSLRTMGAQFKQYLETRAQASQVQWSYDYIQGRNLKVGLVANPNVIYTIMGQAIYRRPQSTHHHRPRKLLLIENHSPHLYNALEVVVRSFGDEPVEVVRIKNNNGNTKIDAIRQYSSLAEKRNLTILELQHLQLHKIIADSSIVFDYAIVSRHEPLDSLNQICTQLRCPIILVS
ncbi:MAG: hypothetical protein V7459_09235 [Oceanicoccus sp.]